MATRWASVPCLGGSGRRRSGPGRRLTTSVALRMKVLRSTARLRVAPTPSPDPRPVSERRLAPSASTPARRRRTGPGTQGELFIHRTAEGIRRTRLVGEERETAPRIADGCGGLPGTPPRQMRAASAAKTSWDSESTGPRQLYRARSLQGRRGSDPHSRTRVARAGASTAGLRPPGQR
jgi:hypothetical protein